MQIVIVPSFCKVYGTSEELRWLRDLLTFDVPTAKYMNLYRRGHWDGKKRFFSLMTRLFPVGLLDYVLSHKESRIITLQDCREFPRVDVSAPILKTIELRDYQKQAIQICLTKKNCIVEAATNAGKTAIFSGIIKRLYPHPTLVLTHRLELLKQTVDFIEQYTGYECGFITAQDVLIKPVLVAMVPTLVNRLGVSHEIDNFFESLVGLIIDETHHVVSKSFTSIAVKSKAVYRFGFSGTIPAENTIDGMQVRQFIGPVAFRISNVELIDLKVSAKPKIFLYEIDVKEKTRGLHTLARMELENSGKDFSTKDVMRRMYDLVIDKAIVNNAERNSKVVDVIRQETNKSILIVVDYLEHGRIVEELLVAHGITSKFISGDSPDRTVALESFKRGKLKVLIATSIVDEGLSIERVSVLILLGGKKSRRQLLQRIGRSLRRKEGENAVKIFDFVDCGNRYTERHSRERLKIYQAEKFELEFIS